MDRLIDPTLYPPTGLLYIAAAVEKLTYTHSVSVMNLGADTIDEAVSKLSDFDVVGVSIVSPYWNSALELARRCKKLVVAGGPHVSADVTGVYGSGAFDSVFVGQSERSFVKFLDDVECGTHHRVYESIAGPIDELPMPKIEWGHGDRGVVILSSRGCVNRCAFCASHVCFNKIQLHSPERVLAEVDRIVEAGKVSFRFLDDMFAISTARLEKICAGLKERNVDWSCHTRVDRVSDKIVKMMKDAGCYEMGLGVESFDQRVLDACDKGTTVKQNLDAIRIIAEHGIDAHVYMMIGTPGETAGTAALNMLGLEATKSHFKRLQFSTFMPFPGSDTWVHPEDYGIKIVDKDFCSYTQHQYEKDGDSVKETPLWSPIRIDGLSHELQMDNLKTMRDYIDHLKAFRSKRIPLDG